jgi:hypothetical protein
MGYSFLWFECMTPLQLGGLGGGEEYPWRSLGGTSEVFIVSKRGLEQSASVGEHPRILIFGYGVS